VFGYFGIYGRVNEISWTEWILVVLSLAAHFWAYTMVIDVASTAVTSKKKGRTE
jgi:hypothetical protein